MATFALATVLVIFGVVLLAGTVTGLAGFGFAVIGTTVLATVIDPSAAVVLMILPILGANVSLVRELDAESLRSCARRFWPFVAAAVVGTLAGMAVLNRLPSQPITLALGVLTLGYVGLSQERVQVPGVATLERACFTDHPAAKVGLGLVSGLVFGATNVGVQVIAYLDSLSLDRSTFVGVVAMIFLGISSVRVGAAATLGLYGSTAMVAYSALAVGPGLVGVAVGRRLRPRVSERVLTAGTHLLLSVIGLRLTIGGLGWL
jgi:uncharacterized membrane protein YfcA